MRREMEVCVCIREVAIVCLVWEDGGGGVGREKEGREGRGGVS